MLLLAAAWPAELIAAASRLFNQRGIDGASLDDIGAEVGATKGAVYHYFDDKADLVTRCYRRAFELYDLIMDTAVEQGRDGFDKALIALHLNVQAQAGPASPLMLRVASVLSNLTEEESATLPWHRVTASDGRISPRMPPALARKQRARLRADGTFAPRPSPGFLARLKSHTKKTLLTLIAGPKGPDALDVGRFRLLSGSSSYGFYDRYSLRELFKDAGFSDVSLRSPDVSGFRDWKDVNLDLSPGGQPARPHTLIMEGVRGQA